MYTGHTSFMELGHLLTRSGLTYPEVSSKFYHDSFYQLGSSVSLPWVIYCEAFYLHVVTSFSCIRVICPKLVLFNSFAICTFVLYSVQVYPAVLLMYFISAAVILLASLALIVQVSLPYNKIGRASVLYGFILVFLRGFCGLHTLFKIPVIFKKLFNLLRIYHIKYHTCRTVAAVMNANHCYKKNCSR